MMTQAKTRRPTHPGQIFDRQVLQRLGIDKTKAAEHLGLSRQTVSKFCNGRSACTPDLANRLAAATNSTVAVWINLQAAVDAWEAERLDASQVTAFPNSNVA